MEAEEFGQTYLQQEATIAKVLRKQKIYDEDLMHDTYIALYEHSQKEEINDFVSMFVTFYKNMRKRRKKEADYFETCDNATMIEKYDRIDEDDWERRERIMQRIDVIIAEFSENPLPGERKHERACAVIDLYRNGLTFREIADELGIDVAAVYRHLNRAIGRIKSQQKLTII